MCKQHRVTCGFVSHRKNRGRQQSPSCKPEPTARGQTAAPLKVPKSRFTSQHILCRAVRPRPQTQPQTQPPRLELPRQGEEAAWCSVNTEMPYAVSQCGWLASELPDLLKNTALSWAELLLPSSGGAQRVLLGHARQGVQPWPCLKVQLLYFPDFVLP